MDDVREGQRAALPRRGVLKALAVATAAAAGCAAGTAERGGLGDGAAAGEAGRPAGRSGEAAGETGSAAAIRAFPVPADAEPAFVFRAASGRPGGLR